MSATAPISNEAGYDGGDDSAGEQRALLGQVTAMAARAASLSEELARVDAHMAVAVAALRRLGCSWHAVARAEARGKGRPLNVASLRRAAEQLRQRLNRRTRRPACLQTTTGLAPVQSAQWTTKEVEIMAQTQEVLIRRRITEEWAVPADAPDDDAGSEEGESEEADEPVTRAPRRKR